MIHLGKVWTVFKKEFRESMRDKSVLFTNFFLPILALPLFVFVLVATKQHMNKEISKETYQFLLVGKTPSSVKKIFTDDERINILKPKKYLNKFLKNVQKEEVRSYMERQKLDLIVFSVPDGDNIKLLLYQDLAIDRGLRAGQLAKKLLENWKKDELTKRLQSLGITQKNITPVEIKNVNVAMIKRMMGERGGTPLGAYIIFLLIVAIYNPAINGLIGEKTKNTLTPLLMTPVRVQEVLFGKYLNITLIGLLGILPYFVDIGLVYLFVKKSPLNSTMDGMGLAYPGLFLFSIFSIALFLSSLSFFISSLARSLALAQTFMSVLMLMVVIPIALINILNLKLDATSIYIPVLNFCLLMREVFIGEGTWGLGLAACLVNIFYSWGILAFSVQLFKEQNVLSESTTELNDLLSFKPRKVEQLNPVFSFFAFLVVVSPLLYGGLFTPISRTFWPLFKILTLTILPLGLLWHYKYSPSKIFEGGEVKSSWAILTILFGISCGHLFQMVAGESSSLGSFGSVLFHTTLIAAMVEEWFYRGIILTGLRRRYSMFFAVILSAGFYSVGQMSLVMFPGFFMIGLLSGLLRECKGHLGYGLFFLLGITGGRALVSIFEGQSVLGASIAPCLFGLALFAPEIQRWFTGHARPENEDLPEQKSA